MKTSEAKKKAGSSKKTTAKAGTATTRKKTAAVRTVRTRKAAAKKPEPTEEQIRQKALEIYNERVRRGEHGTPEDDWFKAVEALR